jgi:hypothetical protein
MTTLESMAIAVLRGDLAAARALADSLREEHSEGMMELPPVHRIKCDRDKLRVIVFCPIEVVIDKRGIHEVVEKWIAGNGSKTLAVQGVERIELYEMPG